MIVQSNLIQTALKFNKGCNKSPIETDQGYLCPQCTEFLIGKIETTCLNSISTKYKCLQCNYCWCSIKNFV